MKFLQEMSVLFNQRLCCNEHVMKLCFGTEIQFFIGGMLL
jgi:hypothetical protein